MFLSTFLLYEHGHGRHTWVKPIRNNYIGKGYGKILKQECPFTQKVHKPGNCTQP